MQRSLLRAGYQPFEDSYRLLFRSHRVRCAARVVVACVVCLVPTKSRVCAQEATAAHVRSRAAIDEGAAASRRARGFVRSHGAGAVGSSAQDLTAARAQHLSMVAAQAVSLATAWVPAGPVQVQSQSYGLLTGRVTALALDPNDATNNTLFVGTSGGGVWKSVNAVSGTVAFTPLTDTLPVFSPNAGTSVVPSLSIGALSVQMGGTGVVLAGTGDPNDAADSYYGEGVLRSTDKGQTWSLIQSASGGAFIGEGVSGFAWSTSSPSLVVMAVSSAAEAGAVGASANPGVRGLYYSTNAGASWTLATIQDGSTVVQNRTTNYANFRGNAATSVVWNPVRRMFYAAVRSHGYYGSPDGITWTRLANQPGAGLTTENCPPRPGDYGLTSCPMFRGTLAVQPVSGDLFAVTVDANNATQGLWQDACAKNGTACASSTPAWSTSIDISSVTTNGTLSAGDYNLALAAVPAATALSTTDTLLFLGIADLYRCSLAGGCTLRNATNATTGCAAPAGVAPAQHALAWGTNLSNSATPSLFVGNDGGLWRSLDGVRQQAAVCSADDATHFDNLNSGLGSLAEVVSLSSHPTDGSVMLAALGANGAAVSTSLAQATGATPWTQLTAAESGTVSIDQGDGSKWLLQSGGGVALHACSSGLQCAPEDFAGPAAIGYTQVNGDASLVDPPALLDPAWNANVLLGTCRVWRGPVSGGSAWSTSNAISAPMLGLLSSGTCTTGNATIRSLAAGGAIQLNSAPQNSGSPVLYAGLSGAVNGGASSAGHIFRTAAAGTAGMSTVWTDLTANSVTNDTSRRFNASGFDISSIAVDRADATGMTVYATVQGFGSPHVYRSINGGATWLNISANLPNAPANAVVVDPNNPRVVYVAMDTGVYVTADVTTCVSAATGTTGACWSVYGTSLPNSPVMALSVAAGATLPGSSTMGILRAATYGRGIWQMPLYSAGQTFAAAISISPSSLAFGSQAVGTTSAAQSVTVTNTGTANLQISSAQPSAGFLETDTCAGTTLTVNATCTLTVRFAPVTAGSTTGSVQLVANVAGGYASLPLSGAATGVAHLAVSPTAVSFGDIAVNATSAAQIVTVSNTGSASATLAAAVVTPGYSITANTCAATLDAGATCAVSVVFAPTSAGPNNGTLTVGGTGTQAVVQLSANGVGRANVVYSSSSIAFANGIVGTVARGVVFTFGNTGTAASNISLPVIVGDFSYLQDTCSAVVFPGANCSVLVFFVPQGLGLRTGSMTFTDNTGAHVIALSGTGILGISLSLPTDLTFPDTDVNSVSPAQTLTLFNPGYPATFGTTQVVGDFAVRPGSCGTGLLTGASCNLQVVFAPLAEGFRDGYVQVTFGGVDYYTRLHGVAHGHPLATITPSQLVFGTVGVGSRSDPQTVAIANTGTGALVLQSQTVTTGFQIISSNCSTTLAVGSTCALTVAFAPTTGGSQSGTLTLVDSTGTHTVALNGTGYGQASVSMSPATVDFGTVPVGQAALQDVTVSNTGTADISLLTPATSGDFSVTATTCGSRIAAGTSCVVTVRFLPTVDGGRAGTLTLADTAGPHTVILTGNGRGTAALTFAPLALVFGNTAVNTMSATQTVTLTNRGTASAVLNTAVVEGDFRIATQTCGGTLDVAASCTLSIAFAPGAAGFRSGDVSVTGADGTHSVALQGTGTAGTLTVSPVVLDFPDTAVNNTTAARTVTLTNTGNSLLTLGTTSVTDDFAASANCNGISLAGGSTCALSITFSPRTAGPHTGSVSIPSNSNGVPGTLTTVALTGIGKSAFNITLTPASVDFGTQVIGSSSAVVNVTVSNTGTVSGSLGLISVAGADFSIRANTCGPTLAPQTGCTVSLVFTPTAHGARSGTLRVLSDAGSQAVPLTGTGQAAATDGLSPLTLTFAQQTVGSTSPPQTVTLTNSGDVPLTLVAARVLSGDFTAVHNCGPTLAARTSCAISVAFAPRSVGAQGGVLQVTDVKRAQTVTLNGTGLAAAGVTLTPASLTFANTGVGVVGAAQTLTVSNNTGAPVSITGIALTGSFGVLTGAGTCSTATVLTAGGACTLGVAFLPQAAGLQTGSLTVTTSGPSLTSQLDGTGVDFTLAPNGSTSATLSSGGSATYPLLLRPAVTTNDAVTFACAGAPAYANCTVTSQYSDLSATGTVSVTLLTGTASTKSMRGGGLWTLLLLPFFAVPGRVGRRAACLLLLCCAAWTAQGCGSTKASALSGTGEGGGGSGGVTTPTGTYTITVSATAAGVTHTVPLTLKVQ